MTDQVLTPTAIEPRPVGKPTVMTQITLDKLRTAFLMGCSDREACSFAEISPATLYNYQVEHPEYVEQKELWKDNPVLKARSTVYKALDNPETAKWYLERKNRGEFATRTENVNYDINDIEKTLDKLETNYDDVARQASGQMVETNPPVQDQGQTGQPADVSTEHNAAPPPSGEGEPPVQ